MATWKHAWDAGHGKASWANRNRAWAISHVRDVYGFLARGFGRASVGSSSSLATFFLAF